MSRIKPLKENILLNVTITSDIHIDVKNDMPWLPKWFLKRSLKQAMKSEPEADVYVSVGDMTTRGNETNWSMAKECFDKYNLSGSIMLAIGNHDCWNDDGYDEAIKCYYDFFEKICGFKITKPYFSRSVKGYNFIFLGNESDAGCEANISDEQIEWLRQQLNENDKKGRPAFVFCHQSLNQKHGLPRTWDKNEKPDRKPDEGGVGEKSDNIEQELKKHKCVLYFSGHSHMGLAGELKSKAEGFSTIEEEGNLTLINLPALSCANHHGEINRSGIGFQVEIYADEIILRPRDFRYNKWMKKIPLQNGNPYYEIKL